MLDSANKPRARKSAPVFGLLIVLVLILVITLVTGILNTNWLSTLSDSENAQSIESDMTDPVLSTSYSAEPDLTHQAQLTTSDSTQSRFPLDTHRLLLVGVVLSSDNLGSNAIIEYQGNQNSYSIGDSVYHHQVLLTQIGAKSAVIQYQESSHTLYLQMSIHQPGLSSSSRENSAFDEKSKAVPPDLGQYIAVKPVYEQGILNGLLATPRGDSSIFLQLGLMSEDIITEINGVSMTSTEGIGQASALFQTPGPLQLSIRRQGQVMTVLIDPPHDVL
ncbi:type II secretion system protein N [Lacimicrobium alkaliphilum]|uniref:Type II secretion system protein GspC N-terminal domain-containing protein n=1 Tax=Lacimicrobium alkaliphilum TaxID=1526571 RepID=A0A0U3AAM8_9ALTE|nr:type II secretion system protein N [Lacimicrobium alkaliphilum]ALS98062.1 hypothetical protein AT746_07160 [Lacimicrobium alkaliphilum]